MVDKERLVSRSLHSWIVDRSSFSDKEAFYEREIILADRDMVETESDDILKGAEAEDVALLVVGDPLG